MKCDIFIRTYDKDAEWLKYCVRSIEKYAKGFNDLIITYPEGHNICKQKIGKNFEIEPYVSNGYIDQQITKLKSYKFCSPDTTHILFVDSDACFTNNFYPQSFLKNSSPIVYMTPYVSFTSENDKPGLRWKRITEKFLQLNVEFEFMRRSPYLFKKNTLFDLNNWFIDKHNMPIETFLKIMTPAEISEFNLIGAYIYYIQNKDDYTFINTLDEFPPKLDFFLQNWSWGGLTHDIKQNLELITI